MYTLTIIENMPASEPVTMSFSTVKSVQEYMRDSHGLTWTQTKTIRKSDLIGVYGSVAFECPNRDEFGRFIDYDSGYIVTIEPAEYLIAEDYETIPPSLPDIDSDVTDFTFIQTDHEIESIANHFGYSFYDNLPVLAWIKVGEGDYDSPLYYSYSYSSTSVVYKLVEVE